MNHTGIPYDLNKFYSDKYGVEVVIDDRFPSCVCCQYGGEYGTISVAGKRHSIADLLVERGYDGIDEMVEALVKEVQNAE